MNICSRPRKSGAARGADPSWFSACSDNKTDVVKAQLGKCKRSFDRRDTDFNVKVYKGFSGLHYACMTGALNVVTTLLEYEYDLYTQVEAVLTMATMSSGDTKFKCAAGTSPLMIAIISGNMDVALTILNFASSKGEDVLKRMVGIQNERGQTALMCFCMIDSTNVLTFLYAHQKLLMRYEIGAETIEGLTALQIAATFGRNYVLDSVCKTLLKLDTSSLSDLEFKMDFVKALLKRDRSGRDIFYYVENTVQYEHFSTSLQNKQACKVTLLSVFKDVVLWLITNPVEKAKELINSGTRVDYSVCYLNDALIINATNEDFFINSKMTTDQRVLDLANKLDCYVNCCQLLNQNPDEILLGIARTYLDENGNLVIKPDLSVVPAAIFGQQEAGQDRGNIRHVRQESGLSTASEDSHTMSSFDIIRNATSHRLYLNENGMLVLQSPQGNDISLNASCISHHQTIDDLDS
ncbi:Ankyrin repeat protein [Giardia duodenalis]|uniref:Ankyrin repeat protein n=1 Tax=Giardia intestinalis TaxID=5741 RepID=V6TG45_GIAIN|nr:Ankyrin repeat protein [Giardia intestinalis]